MAENLNILSYNRPINCEVCGEKLRFTGLGEYMCDGCKHLQYDDYGKVRNYIEEHHGATQSEVSQATGVPINRIRQMLREEKIEIAQNSVVFLHCEACGREIRSGIYCDSCQKIMYKSDAAMRKASRNADMHGFGMNKNIDSTGEKRFRR